MMYVQSVSQGHTGSSTAAELCSVQTANYARRKGEQRHHVSGLIKGTYHSFQDPTERPIGILHVTNK